MRLRRPLALSALLLGGGAVAWVSARRADETPPRPLNPVRTLLETLDRAQAKAVITGRPLVVRVEAARSERVETAPK